MQPESGKFIANNIFDAIGNINVNFPAIVSSINNALSGDWVIYLKFGLIILSVVFIVCLVIVSLRIIDVLKKLHDQFYPHTEHHGDTHGKNEAHSIRGKMKSNWDTVALHMASNNPSDWKLSILEADSILDELTKDLHLSGDTLGERLRSVGPGQMKTIQFAWDAHKFRNRIAHEGISAKITRDDAIAVLGQFERVFREFDYI